MSEYKPHGPPLFCLLMHNKGKVGRTLFVTWASAFVVIETARIWIYLRAPDDGDLFSHSWSYQIFVALIFRLPIWILGLAGILGIAYLGGAAKRKAEQKSPVLKGPLPK